MTPARGRSMDPEEVQKAFTRINDQLSVVRMTSYHEASVRTAQRVLEARRRIDARAAEVASGMQHDDWTDWLIGLRDFLYRG